MTITNPPYYKKPRQPTNQVIVSLLDDKFLIGKKFAKSTAIVTPFEKIDDVFISNFQAPNNRSRRVEILYNMIPKISRYSVSDTGVEFDCVKAIHEQTDIFDLDESINSGYIHFDVTTFRKKEGENQNPTLYIDINPRVMFSKIPEQDDIEIKLDDLKYKFRTPKLKAFSVVLEKGFILCVVNRIKTCLYMTINNPKKKFVGNCVRKEINNITSNIFPLWPIFNINMNSSKLGLHTKDIITKNFRHIDQPLLIKMERAIEHPMSVISCLGVSIETNETIQKRKEQKRPKRQDIHEGP